MKPQRKGLKSLKEQKEILEWHMRMDVHSLCAKVRPGWTPFLKGKAGKTVIEDADPALADPEDIEDPAVFVKETWFRYEKDTPDVLKGVVLRVPRKTLFAVVGGNGTGKSTLLKTICNTCKPYRGKVLIDGKPVGKYKDSELFRHNLALLPQDRKACL